MSIATLKRKTMKSYRIMSSGLTNFSLNGTLRNQGYVGQTSLSRSLPRTLMKGNVACGYGGCCGTYRVMPIVQSAVTSLNNPKVIKSSVVNTRGMIDTKYRWVKRPQPFATVKPDGNSNLNTESDHIANLKKKTLDKINNCKFNNIAKTPCNSSFNTIFRSHLFPKRCTTMQPVINKESNYLRTSYSDEYLTTLNNKCSSEHDVFYVANKLGKYAYVS